MPPSLQRSLRRGVIVALALLVPAIATADAHAAVSLGITPSIPAAGGAVTVGQTVPSSFALQNFSTGPEAALHVTINTIALVPSCGTTLIAADCPVAQVDPDVFSLSATGIGRAGTGCAGISFSIVDVDQMQDKYQFVGTSPVVLGPAANGGPLARCTIDFTVSVLKVPAIDARADLPGVQTSNHASADATASNGLPGGALGTSITQFLRAQPTIATTATAFVLLVGSMTDKATVGGRVNPVAGATVTFRLYGPADPGCSGVPLFTSTVPYLAAGGPATSAPYTPTKSGTYHWIAAYSGDVNNNPVSGGCNDSGESTLVVLLFG